MGVENIKIQPMRVYIGDDTKQEQKITCAGDVASSLAGTYFLAHTPGGEKHAFWLDNGIIADVVITGWTMHAVIYAPGDSATVLAGKIQAVADALTTKFDATVSGKVITLTCVEAGYALPARDGADATGFAFAVSKLGFAKQEIGNLEGDIEISGFEVSKQEIKTHATGSTVQGEIITGYSKPTMKLNLYDTNKDAIKKAIVLMGGHSLIPEDAGASELIGYGPTSVGGASPTVRLTLHPVNADASEKDQDWNIWKASFNMDSFKFSGENFSSIPLTISIYPDETKPKLMQFFAIGDVEAAGY